MQIRSFLSLLGWGSGLLGAFLTLRRLSIYGTWVVRLAIGTALLGVALIAHSSGQYFLIATDAILALFVFGLSAGFVCTQKAASLRRGVHFAVRLLLVLWASLLLTLLVNNISSYVLKPQYLIRFPEFALRHMLDGLNLYLVAYSRPLLFSVYNPTTLSPRVWIYLLLGIELLSPGLLLGLVKRLFDRRDRPTPSVRRPRLASLIVLVLAVSVLVGILWLRSEQGFLTAETAQPALRCLLRFALPPILFFALLWRWLKKMDRESSSPDIS
jgi:hypothetical protein